MGSHACAQDKKKCLYSIPAIYFIASILRERKGDRENKRERGKQRERERKRERERAKNKQKQKREGEGTERR